MIELWIVLELFPIRWMVYRSYKTSSVYYVTNIFWGLSGYLKARRYIRRIKGKIYENKA